MDRNVKKLYCILTHSDVRVHDGTINVYNVQQVEWKNSVFDEGQYNFFSNILGNTDGPMFVYPDAQSYIIFGNVFYGDIGTWISFKNNSNGSAEALVASNVTGN